MYCHEEVSVANMKMESAHIVTGRENETKNSGINKMVYIYIYIYITDLIEPEELRMDG